MNVFVLCTGRTGSHTFYEACRHLTNYTASHESQRTWVGKRRFEYPENHIAIDLRLAWMLGRMDALWGKNAFYVHLTRDAKECAKSWVRLCQLERLRGATQALNLPEHLHRPGGPVWAHMHVQALKLAPLELVAEDMVRSINSDIRMFLKDKDWMPLMLERAEEDFPLFLDRIGAEGDLEAAQAEWRVKHEATIEADA